MPEEENEINHLNNIESLLWGKYRIQGEKCGPCPPVDYTPVGNTDK